MKTKLTQKEIADARWEFTAGFGGGHDTDQIVAAAALETSRKLDSLLAHVRDLSLHIARLSQAGIHDVVREHARKARAAAAARKRRATKRRAAKARKP